MQFSFVRYSRFGLAGFEILLSENTRLPDAEHYSQIVAV
jgi:hypothetical protein